MANGRTRGERERGARAETGNGRERARTRRVECKRNVMIVIDSVAIV